MAYLSNYLLNVLELIAFKIFYSQLEAHHFKALSHLGITEVVFTNIVFFLQNTTIMYRSLTELPDSKFLVKTYWRWFFHSNSQRKAVLGIVNVKS